MKKVLKMENLDCANCAAKMERNIAKIDGVNSVSVNFMSQKMIIDVDDNKYNEIVKEIRATCKKVEPDCTIL